MFEALWLATFLIALAVFRWVRNCILCQSRCECLVRYLLCADYFVLYAFFLGFLISSLSNVFKHLPQLEWLDPATLEQQFSGVSEAANSTLDSTDFNQRKGILHDVTLRHYAVVRWTSLFAPAPVFFTWLVCSWDTFKHARNIWSKTGLVPAHDYAIQIIALPMVYSLMSLSALLRMWKVMSNFFGDQGVDWMDAWDEELHHALEIYEADYQIADLYEAWALHHFAVLAMQVLRRTFDSSGAMLHNSANAVDVTSPVYQAWAGTMKGLHNSVRHLTMQGIWSFVIVCAVQSLYGLSMPLLAEAFANQFPDFIRAVRQSSDKVRFFFLGTGSVASTAAICNILQIERTFHYELLHFKPFWKFWGTKVLVSIAFLQSLLFMLPIPPFKDMSTVQANLAYSTLLCYECFFISLLHLYAWGAHEEWYKEGVEAQEEAAALTALDSLELRNIAEASSISSLSEPRPSELGLRRLADADGDAV